MSVLLTGTAQAATVTGSSTAARSSTAPVTPVATLDLDRYLGHWYQLAAIPAVYEIQCAKNSAADYRLNTDGTLAVHNTCTTWFGGTSAVDGTAKSDSSPANSTLSVSFLSVAGTPLYFGGPNYVVFGLDAAYRWAVVGDPDHQSGFVLSRTRTLSARQIATITRTITANGYDACSFHVTPQDGGSSSGGPIC